ncbi:MAG: nucleotidyltransferase domain-containing protein [Defluviitaleaceae bacterium]|nr:nucleotidyltransferase domain-containing protein [Defluviitaleaceae bacterium]MCL2262106.1 nucleotidyltransferase domain-containing protein [Defluviitaleaceae bacterium]
MTYTVDEIKNKLRPIFEEQNVIRATLFGSYTKGEATAESDIDIAALVDDEMSILNFCDIADKVINALGKNVDFLYANDIIPGGKIDLELKKSGVLLYESG